MGATVTLSSSGRPRRRAVGVWCERSWGMISGVHGASILSEYVHNLPPSYREDPEGNLVRLLRPSGGA